jgi:hypothetical protein
MPHIKLPPRVDSARVSTLPAEQQVEMEALRGLAEKASSSGVNTLAGLEVMGSDASIDALAMMGEKLPGTDTTLGGFAMRALGYGTLLSVASAAAFTVILGWWWDAWSLMDFSDKLFAVVPSLRKSMDESVGESLRRASSAVNRVAPKLGHPDPSHLDSTDERWIPDLPASERRELDQAGAEWDDLEEEYRIGQERRRQQMLEKGLVPSEGVTLPARSHFDESGPFLRAPSNNRV